MTSAGAPAYDVVVVGAGVAGLSTALGLVESRSVLVVAAGDGSTRWAQGGIAAAFGNDKPADHAADTLVAAADAGDPESIRLLTEEGPARVAELIALGAHFDHDENGELQRGLEGGHHYARIVHAGGDATGAEVARALWAAAEQTKVPVKEGIVTGLLLAEDGRVAGVRTRGGEDIRARAVVLATGGLGHAYVSSTNPSPVRGDGLALALRAGATLTDMEFVQFHPTALYTGKRNGQVPLVTEAMRGAGAVLRDKDGVAFMQGVHELADLAPRDIVAREIDWVMDQEHISHVWLDAREIDDAVLDEHFPTVTAACKEIGVDPKADQIPVAPAEHFLCGGVRVDDNGATDVPGLYAVGEVAATGVHGANRLASNSLLEGLVFGRRVAAALTLALPEAAEAAEGGTRVAELGADETPDQIRTLLSTHAGIRRHAYGLSKALSSLDGLGEGPLATIARTVVTAALARKESRGCHWRSDYPATAEVYLPISIKLGGNGRPYVVEGDHRPSVVARVDSSAS